MSCIIDNGYVLSCSSIGGVEKVYLGNWSADASFAVDLNDIITGATSASTVYSFEMDIEYGGLEQNAVPNRENGTNHLETLLSLKFIDLDASLRNTMNALMRAPLYAVVKSNSGNFYLAGLESAGRMTEGTVSLGTSMEDMNGGTATITWKSKNGVYLMDGSVLGTDITIG